MFYTEFDPNVFKSFIFWIPTLPSSVYNLQKPFTVSFKIVCNVLYKQRDRTQSHSVSYFCPQYSWIFKMYFYCRGGLRQVPVKFQRGNISIKDSQLKLENPNSKGEIQGLSWSNIPMDNLTLENCDEIPILDFITCYHGNILRSERKYGDWVDLAFIGSWSHFILLP